VCEAVCPRTRRQTASDHATAWRQIRARTVREAAGLAGGGVVEHGRALDGHIVAPGSSPLVSDFNRVFVERQAGDDDARLAVWVAVHVELRDQVAIHEDVGQAIIAVAAKVDRHDRAADSGRSPGLVSIPPQPDLRGKAVDFPRV
jgi:hypothetical protein